MIDETLAAKRFVLGACAQLGFEVTQEGGVYRCAARDDEAETFQGLHTFSFSFENSSASASDSNVIVSDVPKSDNQVSEANRSEAQSTVGQLSSVAVDSPLVNWLVSRLKADQADQSPCVLHAQPQAQPATVHEISDQLFGAYTIDGGSAHLSGCRLEDRPFVCLTLRQVVDGKSRIAEVLVDQEGQSVDEATQAALRLAETKPITEHPPRLAPEKQEQLIEAATRLARSTERSSTVRDSNNEQTILQSDVVPQSDILAVTLIWWKWATGKLCFTIGEESIELPFEGWAATLQAPAFACLRDGKESFHLASTDDGRITAAEAIAICQQSQRRVLADELVLCSVTGRSVLPEFLVPCGATDKPLLESERVTCPGCRLEVSPAALLGKGCLACQRTAPVRPSDPRLARILGEHPGLGRWWSWQLAETPTVYIVRAARLLRCLLVVLDKQTLEATHLAQGNRFLQHWEEAPENQWKEYLR